MSIAAFWSVPMFTTFPRWSTEHLNQVLDQNDVAPERVRFSSLIELEQFFPLQPDLHQALGLRLLRTQRSEGWRHFRLADRLRPGSWTLPALQAVASYSLSPGMTFHFWTLAIERAGHRRSEIFGLAYQGTTMLPGAESFWERYVQTNPSLLLGYAAGRPEAEARAYFQQWWTAQALSGAVEAEELQFIYRCIARWGTNEQLEEWMRKYPNLEARDFKTWATIFHERGENVRAWQILAKQIPDPAFPTRRSSTRTDTLEATWLKSPADVVNAQSLAAAWDRAGETAKSKKVILNVATRENAPPWFVQKAAHLEAANGDFAQAVAMLLKEK